MSLAGAKFICLNEKGEKCKVIEAKGRKFTIGYYMSCDHILDDNRSKGLHCEINCDAFGRVTIHNMSEEHPVSINGKPIVIKRPLLSGYKITILGNNYIWDFPKVTSSEYEDINMSTPEMQIGIPEQPPNSCPDLKLHRDIQRRFTVHNFAYCIQFDDEGNTSIDSNQANETTEQPEKVDTASDNEVELIPIMEETATEERCVTPEAQIGNSLIVDAEETPKINLINCTQNKENASTEKKIKLLSLCHQSDIVITSFSPRETGIRIEKSFTKILKPTTPKSVYSTPKSVLSEMNDDGSRDFMEFSTPATSKKTLSRGVHNSSMHLIDLTTPSKLRPASPYLKSATKSSTSKSAFTKFDKKNQQFENVLEECGVSLLGTPKMDDKQTVETPDSVISVDSTDSTESIVEISVEESPTTSSVSKIKTPTKIAEISKLSTPKRTPQSLMKRALLTSAKKQLRTPATPSSHSLLKTTPTISRKVGSNLSPITPKSASNKSELFGRRPDLTTPSGRRILIKGSPNVSAASSSSISDSRRSSLSSNVSRRIPTSTSTPLQRSTVELRKAAKTSPLRKVRKSIGGNILTSYISKHRTSLAMPIRVSPTGSSSAAIASAKLKRKSLLYVSPTNVRARAIVAAVATPASILKDPQSSKKPYARKVVLFSEKKKLNLETEDLNSTFTLETDDKTETNLKDASLKPVNASDEELSTNLVCTPVKSQLYNEAQNNEMTKKEKESNSGNDETETSNKNAKDATFTPEKNVDKEMSTNLECTPVKSQLQNEVKNKEKENDNIVDKTEAGNNTEYEETNDNDKTEIEKIVDTTAKDATFSPVKANGQDEGENSVKIVDKTETEYEESNENDNTEIEKIVHTTAKDATFSPVKAIEQDEGENSIKIIQAINDEDAIENIKNADEKGCNSNETKAEVDSINDKIELSKTDDIKENTEIEKNTLSPVTIAEKFISSDQQVLLDNNDIEGKQIKIAENENEAEECGIEGKETEIIEGWIKIEKNEDDIIDNISIVAKEVSDENSEVENELKRTNNQNTEYNNKNDSSADDLCTDVKELVNDSPSVIQNTDNSNLVQDNDENNDDLLEQIEEVLNKSDELQKHLELVVENENILLPAPIENEICAIEKTIVSLMPELENENKILNSEAEVFEKTQNVDDEIAISTNSAVALQINDIKQNVSDESKIDETIVKDAVASTSKIITEMIFEENSNDIIEKTTQEFDLLSSKLAVIDDNSQEAKTPNLKGIKELLKTPKRQKILKTPNFIGVRNLMRTPKTTKSNESEDLFGVDVLLKTPGVTKVGVDVENKDVLETADQTLLFTPRRSARRASADTPSTPLTPKRITKRRSSISVDTEIAVITPKQRKTTPRVNRKTIIEDSIMEDMGVIVEEMSTMPTGIEENKILNAQEVLLEPETNKSILKNISSIVNEDIAVVDHDVPQAVVLIEEDICEILEISKCHDTSLGRDVVCIKEDEKTNPDVSPESATKTISNQCPTYVNETLGEVMDHSDYDYGKEVKDNIDDCTINETIEATTPKTSKKEKSAFKAARTLERNKVDVKVDVHKTPKSIRFEDVLEENKPSTSADSKSNLIALQLKTPIGCSTPHTKMSASMLILDDAEEAMGTNGKDVLPEAEKLNFTHDNTEFNQTEDESLDKFFRTPRAKNIMVLTSPKSVNIEKSIDSVELVHSTEYDLNTTNVENLEDIFKTPVATALFNDDDDDDAIVNLVEDSNADISAENPEVEEINEKELSAEEAFDELIGQPSNIQTPARKIYKRKSIQNSPFTASEILSDLPKSDIQEWVDSLENVEVPTDSELEITDIQMQEQQVEGEQEITMIENDNEISRDPLTASIVKPISSSAKYISQDSRKENTATTESMINMSTNSSMIDPLSCSAIIVEDKNLSSLHRLSPVDENVASPRVTDISGINMLDQTDECESIFSEPLLVSDDNESKVSNKSEDKNAIEPLLSEDNIANEFENFVEKPQFTLGQRSATPNTIKLQSKSLRRSLDVKDNVKITISFESEKLKAFEEKSEQNLQEIACEMKQIIENKNIQHNEEIMEIDDVKEGIIGENNEEVATFEPQNVLTPTTTTTEQTKCIKNSSTADETQTAMPTSESVELHDIDEPVNINLENKDGLEKFIEYSTDANECDDNESPKNLTDEIVNEDKQTNKTENFTTNEIDSEKEKEENSDVNETTIETLLESTNQKENAFEEKPLTENEHLKTIQNSLCDNVEPATLIRANTPENQSCDKDTILPVEDISVMEEVKPNSNNEEEQNKITSFIETSSSVVTEQHRSEATADIPEHKNEVQKETEALNDINLDSSIVRSSSPNESTAKITNISDEIQQNIEITFAENETSKTISVMIPNESGQAVVEEIKPEGSHSKIETKELIPCINSEVMSKNEEPSTKDKILEEVNESVESGLSCNANKNTENYCELKSSDDEVPHKNIEEKVLNKRWLRKGSKDSQQSLKDEEPPHKLRGRKASKDSQHSVKDDNEAPPKRRGRKGSKDSQHSEKDEEISKQRYTAKKVEPTIREEISEESTNSTNNQSSETISGPSNQDPAATKQSETLDCTNNAVELQDTKEVESSERQSNSQQNIDSVVEPLIETELVEQTINQEQENNTSSSSITQVVAQPIENKKETSQELIDCNETSETALTTTRRGGRKKIAEEKLKIKETVSRPNRRGQKDKSEENTKSSEVSETVDSSTTAEHHNEEEMHAKILENKVASEEVIPKFDKTDEEVLSSKDSSSSSAIKQSVLSEENESNANEIINNANDEKEESHKIVKVEPPRRGGRQRKQEVAKNVKEKKATIKTQMDESDKTVTIAEQETEIEPTETTNIKTKVDPKTENPTCSEAVDSLTVTKPHNEEESANVLLNKDANEEVCHHFNETDKEVPDGKDSINTANAENTEKQDPSKSVKVAPRRGRQKKQEGDTYNSKIKDTKETFQTETDENVANPVEKALIAEQEIEISSIETEISIATDTIDKSESKIEPIKNTKTRQRGRKRKESFSQEEAKGKSEDQDAEVENDNETVKKTNSSRGRRRKVSQTDYKAETKPEDHDTEAHTDEETSADAVKSRGRKPKVLPTKTATTTEVHDTEAHSDEEPSVGAVKSRGRKPKVLRTKTKAKTEHQEAEAHADDEPSVETVKSRGRKPKVLHTGHKIETQTKDFEIIPDTEIEQKGSDDVDENKQVKILKTRGRNRRASHSEGETLSKADGNEAEILNKDQAVKSGRGKNNVQKTEDADHEAEVVTVEIPKTSKSRERKASKSELGSVGKEEKQTESKTSRQGARKRNNSHAGSEKDVETINKKVGKKNIASAQKSTADEIEQAPTPTVKPTRGTGRQAANFANAKIIAQNESMNEDIPYQAVALRRTRKASTVDEQAIATPKTTRGRGTRKEIPISLSINEDTNQKADLHVNSPLPENISDIKNTKDDVEVLTTSRGRMRKPTARAQQFLEEERSKASTPKKRLLVQTTGTDSPTPQKLPARRGRKPSTIESETVSTPQQVSKRKATITESTSEHTHSELEHSGDLANILKEKETSTKVRGRGRKAGTKSQHIDKDEEEPVEKIIAKEITATEPSKPTTGRRGRVAETKKLNLNDDNDTEEKVDVKSTRTRGRPKAQTVVEKLSKREHRLESATTIDGESDEDEKIIAVQKVDDTPTSTVASAKKRNAAGQADDSPTVKRSKRKALIEEDVIEVSSTPSKARGRGRKVEALTIPVSQVEVKEQQEDAPKRTMRATRKK